MKLFPLIFVLFLHSTAVGQIGVNSESIKQQNRKVMQQHGMKPPPTQADIQRDFQRGVQTGNQQRQSKQEIQTIIKELEVDSANDNNYSYNGKFQFVDYNSSTFKSSFSYYQTAYNSIKKMLEGNENIDIKKAIYLIENVINKNSISYTKYIQNIEEVKIYIRKIAREQSIDLSTDLGKHFAIQRLFSDTTDQVFHYDLEDFWGRKDSRNLFVTKLFKTGSGQCRSMPLAYLILAQEMKAESFLAFSPEHSYIMFQHDGVFYNYETTNGCMTTNQWIMGSGYVKVEAIRSESYMHPLNTKEVLARLLIDLATLYREQLGYDRFLNECINTSLAHYYSLHAVMEKANIETAYMDYAFLKKGFPSLERALQDPQLASQYNSLIQRYNEIDDLGYTQMPQSAYENWLKSLDAEKQKRDSKTIKIKLKKQLD